MPVDLHQHLSEFSFGYGVTREVEDLLRGVGFDTTPYLPNLVSEGGLGFDVAYDRIGIPLLLQFKLGEQLSLYRRKDKTKTAPDLSRPFWRFRINTEEYGGQFDLLLKADRGPSEVYYVAPRFSDWRKYAQVFQQRRVLESSVLIRPTEIDEKLSSQNEPDGWHQVVYDEERAYVCSDAAQIEEVLPGSIAERVRSEMDSRRTRFGVALNELLKDLLELRDVRRRPSSTEVEDSEAVARASVSVASPYHPHGQPERLAEREQRLEAYRRIFRSESDAQFAVAGVETLAAGIQLVAVTVGH